MKQTLRRYRLPLAWGVILLASTVLQTFTVLYDAGVTGRSVTLTQALIQEGSSHFMWVVILPFIYWLHGRFSVRAAAINVVVHAAATIPVSLAHVFGMVGLRHAVSALLDIPYRYGFTFDHLLYEYRKDVMTYLIFSAAYVALGYFLARLDERANPAEAVPEVAPTSPAPILERFAVRKRDREVLVSAEDIDWIEAAGNYAILHVGAESHEIRSSLARLETELDPASFVRVHKSSIVNIARVRQVEPWINGDYRIRLQDGTVVPLSRRYRARFEAFVPVRG